MKTNFHLILIIVGKFLLITTVFCKADTDAADEQAILWSKYELTLESTSQYENPLYDVEDFYALFTAPSGKEIRVNGFWNGGREWKIRFMPREPGEWSYRTVCSDTENAGLHGIGGTFKCVVGNSQLSLHQHGPIVQTRGTYHLSHQDGTPFFWLADTTWNGAMKATDEEWQEYLAFRAEQNFTAIQFVTTQWRGLDKDRKGRVAFTGSGHIKLNPDFFKDIDARADAINQHGLVAVPILLWALPFGDATHLSPGYYLPVREAALLAKYIAARLNGNHVVWMLGGDGKYDEYNEDRWLEIAHRVFSRGIQGVTSTHPTRAWLGDIYDKEEWYQIVGYQSSHNSGEEVVNWINKGPHATKWSQIAPRPFINVEPNYEEIYFNIDAEDVRNAAYWSILATPVAGISYGANGIWPWLQQPGERILNHRHPPGTSTWRQCLQFAGGKQMGYLIGFFETFAWWDFRPASHLLLKQPGDKVYNHFVSVSESVDRSTIIAYIPRGDIIQIRNALGWQYEVRWFDPRNNEWESVPGTHCAPILELEAPSQNDYLLVLKRI